MTKRRAVWVAVVWVLAAVVATAWVSSQTGDEVTVGNALFVGVVVATLLSMLVARMRRR